MVRCCLDHGIAPRPKLTRRCGRHTFSPREKRAYIEADLCLMRLPANLGLPGARNRFEELQSIHQRQAAITHGVVSPSRV
jgi:tyrosinase